MSTTSETLTSSLDELLKKHANVLANPDRKEMIRIAIETREAIPAACGALTTWTPPESTGRSPKDTYMVKRDESAHTIDWDSPNCIPMDPKTFDMLWEDALKVLGKKDTVMYTDRVIGADSNYALPIRTVTDKALAVLFTDNMFRSVPKDVSKSIYSDRGFVLLVLPYDKIDTARYKGRLRDLPGGKTSNMAITADFDRRLGIVYGSAYGGSVKKMMFTVMNYLLPGDGILPIHCSANEGENGDCALLLGLSGTGKTSLSADPGRALLGDDEHGWSDNGVANFENGCYAKLINLRPDKEPEIFNATFHDDDPLEHGAIVENCMMYPDGGFDVDDERLTPNSRGSYPLSYLTNIKTPPVSGHPKTILFLAADANGVLPPISRLDQAQAMLWFIMGYTSKLAGTETGVVEPTTTFSRFFGAPFMPRHPDDYASLLGKKMAEHGTQVYLVNTGWSGGPYGVGERMDITLTRALVEAALSGKLAKVKYEKDPLFHVEIPTSCPGVPSEVLFPKNTWADKKAFDERAKKLAKQFADQFDKVYGDKGLDPKIAGACPGK
jgi:phosphoenolpyruvate carboxykinase (ATP)